MAAKPILVPYDFNKNQIINAVAHTLAADPGTPVPGQWYYNSTSNRFLYFDGTSFSNRATDSDKLGGQTLAQVEARANHTGTQTASTISDFSSVAQALINATAISSLAAATGNVNLNTNRIINLVDPINPQDAATRNYVDINLAAAANVSTPKGVVRAVSAVNVNIAAPGAAIDGVTAQAGDIFWLNGQTTGTQNGPYLWNGASAAMTRSANWDTNGEAVLGSYWVVEQGSFADRFAILSNDAAINLGTSTPNVVFTSAGSTVTAGNGLTGTTTFAVLPDPVTRGGILVSSAGVKVDPAVVTLKQSFDVGDGSATSIVLTHNLNTYDVEVQVYLNSGTRATVECDVQRTTVNTVTLIFAVAPTAAQYRATVQG